MRLDDSKGIQSVKLAWSVLQAELKTLFLPPLQGNNKRSKTNTHTHIRTFEEFYERLSIKIQTLWFYVFAALYYTLRKGIKKSFESFDFGFKISEITYLLIPNDD